MNHVADLSGPALKPAPSRAPRAPQPAHVPDRLVYDFDLFGDARLKAIGHDRILELARTAPPVFWTPHNGGHWMLCSYDAAYKAARDPDSFTSEFTPFAKVKAMMENLPEGVRRPLVPVPINLDPPEHAKYRAPLNSAFSPRAVMALRDEFRALAIGLIEQARPNGGCEFMTEIAEPLPVTLFLRIFGLPAERQREYRDLAAEDLAGIGQSIADPSAVQRRLWQIVDICRDTLLERQANPQDDLISSLWKLEIDGKPMTLADMENFSIVLFLGGLDTVMNGMGHGIRHLAMNPELQARLRAEPKLIPDAAEEILRRYTFTVPPRMVAKDLVFDGVEMKKGERAYIFLPAADLDSSHFPCPERFDLQRENKAHIAFGTGVHRCVGSHLARVELQTLYEVFLARIPQFRLDPDRLVTFHGGHVIGPDALHLLWDA